MGSLGLGLAEGSNHEEESGYLGNEWKVASSVAQSPEAIEHEDAIFCGCEFGIVGDSVKFQLSR